ncbi:hypothetical protein DFH09DRAFT_1081673 [Mycena vulgaris]|nr:hypothetical protein DFH09DRAFT_1081673 [Mycena vulgaris]
MQCDLATTTAAVDSRKPRRISNQVERGGADEARAQAKSVGEGMWGASESRRRGGAEQTKRPAGGAQMGSGSARDGGRSRDEAERWRENPAGETDHMNGEDEQRGTAERGRKKRRKGDVGTQREGERSLVSIHAPSDLKSSILGTRNPHELELELRIPVGAGRGVGGRGGGAQEEVVRRMFEVEGDSAVFTFVESESEPDSEVPEVSVRESRRDRVGMNGIGDANGNSNYSDVHSSSYSLALQANFVRRGAHDRVGIEKALVLARQDWAFDSPASASFGLGFEFECLSFASSFDKSGLEVEVEGECELRERRGLGGASGVGPVGILDKFETNSDEDLRQTREGGARIDGYPVARPVKNFARIHEITRVAVRKVRRRFTRAHSGSGDQPKISLADRNAGGLTSLVWRVNEQGPRRGGGIDAIHTSMRVRLLSAEREFEV